MTDEPQSFEAAEKELAEIVDRLERGDTTLDDALVLWERGEALHRFCVDRLDAAQGKIEELAARAAAQKPDA